MPASSSHAPGAPGKHVLPERLHSRGQYLRVQNFGRKFRSQRLVLMVDADSARMGSTAPDAGQTHLGGGLAAEASARMGYTVSRKVGNAVVRNRVRRILKEAVRLDALGLCVGLDHVVVAHPQAAQAPTLQLQQELMCLLERARAWAQAKPSATGLLPCTG